MIANKYKLIEKINEGSFGTIFKAENIRTKEQVAIKFEDKSEQTTSLKNEARIYQYLGRLDGFPQLKTFGTTDKVNYLVMDLLGNSLDNIIVNYKELPLKIVLVLGIQIIKRIKSLHDKCLLHRDIKPSNFVFGTKNNTNKLFLIDLGFSKRYDYDGKHIEEKNINNIIGSLNFISLNVHNYREPSRRDDLESCVYVILTLLFGNLEWVNETNVQKMILLKQNIIKKDKVPTFIKNMLHYVRTMGFDAIPDYDYLINLMFQEYDNKIP
jgi:serine/threonine protein kinase